MANSSVILTGFIARDAVAVTPNDATDLAKPARALLVGAGGTLKVTMESGSVVTLTVPAGYNSIAVRRVWATGTAATGIVALYPQY